MGLCLYFLECQNFSFKDKGVSRADRLMQHQKVEMKMWGDRWVLCLDKTDKLSRLDSQNLFCMFASLSRISKIHYYISVKANVITYIPNQYSPFG
jgi:hypothetical protein